MGVLAVDHQHDYSTRRLLLNMLKKNGLLSVGDMARNLGITEMAVRRHLNTMERDVIVETKLVRQAMGRPTHMYSLTEHSESLFPKNYHSLTLDLLDELDSDAENDSVGQLFDRRKEKLTAKYRDRMSSAYLEDRVSELAKIQNDNGYMAEWEKDNSFPQRDVFPFPYKRL